MANDLTQFEKDQLTGGGPCNIHQHEVNLAEHRHIDALQSLEVVTNVYGDHAVEYREDILLVDTTTGSATLTLPKSRGGKVFCIVKTKAANSVTILFSNGETMLGVSSLTLSAFSESKRLKAIPNGYIPI